MQNRAEVDENLVLQLIGHKQQINATWKGRRITKIVLKRAWM